MPRSKHFLFASCGPQIPFTWCNAYWGLWVEPTRSWKVISSFHPCQAFSYGHLGWNLIQLSTAWTCTISLSQHFTPTKKDSITWTLSWEIMVKKQKSVVLFTESVANENSEGKHHTRFAFVFFITRLLCLQNFKTLLSLYSLPLVSVMCSCRKYP